MHGFRGWQHIVCTSDILLVRQLDVVARDLDVFYVSNNFVAPWLLG